MLNLRELHTLTPKQLKRATKTYLRLAKIYRKALQKIQDEINYRQVVRCGKCRGLFLDMQQMIEESLQNGEALFLPTGEMESDQDIDGQD